MRLIKLSIFLALLFSCDYFDKKKITSEEILQEELDTFNWNDIDQYPTFDSCDTVEGRDNKRRCFEQTLMQSVNDRLADEVIVVNDSIQDMIKLKLNIDATGNLTIENIEMKPETNNQIPQLDSLLRHSFDSLPKIYPAIKRSQQVSTQFILPVEIKIQ